MEAVISGQAGVALLVDGQCLSSIHVHAPNETVPRRAGEFHYLFGRADDLVFLEDVSLDDARRQLTAASDGQDVLQLVLMLLDSERPSEIRLDAAAELNELLTSNPHAAEYAERLLLAEPLPPTADPEGAKGFCTGRLAQQFIGHFLQLQPAIGKAIDAWRTIPESAFSATSDGTRDVVDAVFVREGVWRIVVLATAGEIKFGTALFSALNIVAVKSLPNHRDVLQRWTHQLRAGAKTHQQAGQTGKEHSAARADDQESLGRSRKGRRRGMDRTKEKGRVDRVIAAIIEAMQGRRPALVRRYVNTLVQEQIARSGEQFACKSLCNLAMKAQEMGLRELQLELTERAVAVSPEDGWALCQYGKALLDNGYLPQALTAYEQAIAVGYGAIGGTGRADTLRSMERYQEALAAYEAAIAADPENAVPKCGRAETLRSMGRYQEALAAYEAAIAADPENAVSMCGRAETLRSMGRFEEALDAYDVTVEAHPNDVFAKTGRAETLRSIGRFQEALDAYDVIVAAHPNDVVAKTGRAGTLRSMGRFEEALNAYDVTVAAHPDDVYAKTGRAETLRSLGRFQEALDAYDVTVAVHPNNVVAKTGRAETLRSMGQFQEALDAYELAVAAHPNDAVAKAGRAETLRSMGRFQEALDAYDVVVAAHPNGVVARNGRAETLRSMGRFEEALDAYEAVAVACPNDVYPKNGRAETLRSMGRFDEALDAYEAVVAARPDDVYAKDGLAETLRSMGRFEEALDAYEAIVAEHPNDPFARNGRASTLVNLGRYEDAVRTLDIDNPMSLSDWVGLHIKGMTFLKQGGIVEAEDLFRSGLKGCPWHYQNRYFASALAVAELRLGKLDAARRSLEAVEAAEDSPPIMLIRLHVAGALNDRGEAEQLNGRLPEQLPRAQDELRDELVRRYLDSLPAARSDDWVFNREIDCLLNAA